jgi:hypothetical protein
VRRRESIGSRSIASKRKEENKIKAEDLLLESTTAHRNQRTGLGSHLNEINGSVRACVRHNRFSEQKKMEANAWMNNGKAKEVQDDEDHGMLRESTNVSNRQAFSFFCLQFTLNKTENKINDEGYNTAGNGNGNGLEDHKDAHKKQKRRRILPDRTETKSTTKTLQRKKTSRKRPKSKDPITQQQQQQQRLLRKQH